MRRPSFDTLITWFLVGLMLVIPSSFLIAFSSFARPTDGAAPIPLHFTSTVHPHSTPAVAKRSPLGRQKTEEPELKTCEALTQDLQHQRAKTREAAARLLGKKRCPWQRAVPQLARLLQDPDVNVRWAVDRALLEYGPQAWLAIPALIETLAHPPTKEWATAVLANIGEAAVPALVVALRDPDMDVRHAAAFTLGAMGQAATMATKPLLHRAKRDKNRRVRRTAVWALASIHHRLVISLTRSLADPSPGVRKAAVRALGQLSSEACPARPKLHQLKWTDPSPEIRQEAAEAMIAMNSSCYQARR